MNPKLEWCVIRLGDDHNWWVAEISDDIHWDVEGLSIIDPSQIGHIIDLCDPLRQYGFDTDLINRAFFTFQIEKELTGKRVRLMRVSESLVENEEVLFALPDKMDEDKGPYADFIDMITKLRVKMLNDMIDFAENLTVEELEGVIRERHDKNYVEGKAAHYFTEITTILEYVPDGYELDLDYEDQPLTPTENDELGEIPELVGADVHISDEDSMKLDNEESKKDDYGKDDLENEIIETVKPRRGRPPKK